MSQNIARRLRIQNNKAIIFTDRLELILGEAGKLRIPERLPELGDKQREPAAIDQAIGQVEQVHIDGRAQFRQV